jgi:non-ribosomal peptide synthetase component F
VTSRPTAGDLTAGTAERDLWSLFKRTAERAPRAVALSSSGDRLTYGELLAQNRSVAASLQHAGVRPGARVALLLPRGAGAPVGMLGVLAAGAAYVPIDPDYPPERVRVLVDDAVPDAVIFSSAHQPDLPVFDERRIDLDQSCSFDGPYVPHDPADSDMPAYVIFTSGSSGRPKGVVVTHGNVLALLRGALPLFDVTEADVWTQFHSMSFDFSVWELWGAFTTGARLVCVPREVALDPRRLLTLLCEQVTVLNQVPSVFRHLVTAYQSEEAPQLSLR